MLSVDPRWEPGAGKPLAGFCPGGGSKEPSLPGQPTATGDTTEYDYDALGNLKEVILRNGA